MIENVGKVISHDEIMIRRWNNDSFIDDNTLTYSIVFYLASKIYYKIVK